MNHFSCSREWTHYISTHTYTCTSLHTPPLHTLVSTFLSSLPLFVYLFLSTVFFTFHFFPYSPLALCIPSSYPFPLIACLCLSTAPCLPLFLSLLLLLPFFWPSSPSLLLSLTPLPYPSPSSLSLFISPFLHCRCLVYHPGCCLKDRSCD